MNYWGVDYKKGAKKNSGDLQIIAESNQPAAKD